MHPCFTASFTKIRPFEHYCLSTLKVDLITMNVVAIDLPFTTNCNLIQHRSISLSGLYILISCIFCYHCLAIDLRAEV